MSNKVNVSIGVNISECERVVYGTKMYDMLDADATQNIYHKDHVYANGMVIRESDIIRMVEMANPELKGSVKVRVITGV